LCARTASYVAHLRDGSATVAQGPVAAGRGRVVGDGGKDLGPAQLVHLDDGVAPACIAVSAVPVGKQVVALLELAQGARDELRMQEGVGKQGEASSLPKAGWQAVGDAMH
jgi:hypothetical protein